MIDSGKLSIYLSCSVTEIFRIFSQGEDIRVSFWHLWIINISTWALGTTVKQDKAEVNISPKESDGPLGSCLVRL